MANSSMLSLPSITAPSAQRLAVTVELIARLEAVEHMAARLRVHAFGAEQILDPERNAFERTALALRQLRVRRLRHLARLVRRHGDIGVERRVGALDRGEIGVGDLGRLDLLGAQFLARFGNRQFGQVAHQAIFFS